MASHAFPDLNGKVFDDERDAFSVGLKLKDKRLWDILKQSGDFTRYDGPLVDSIELSRKIKKAGKKTVLFDNPFGNNEHVVSNLFTSREKLASALNKNQSDLLDYIQRKSRSPKVELIKLSEHDLIQSKDAALPVAIKYYRDDYGPYITSSIILAKDLRSGYVNASIHRLLYLGNREYVIRMVEGRHLHRIFEGYKAEGKDMPVAILVGAMPHVLLAAASPLPWETSELGLASSLSERPLPVIDFSELDFSVPIESEFIMLGKVSAQRTAPEMMTDVLGTYDKIREQPVLEVSTTCHKERPLCHAILPGGYEHSLLMGLPRAAEIRWALIERGIDVKDLTLTPGSGGWLHCFISIRKRTSSDGKDAILVALNAHRSLKGVVVVDDDIDVNDYESIDFAFATRLGSKEQMIWLEGLRGSTLDPSANQFRQTTVKWGLDLTLGTGVDRGKFIKAEIP